MHMSIHSLRAHVPHLCARSQVCAGWKSGSSDPNLLGHCLTATTRYVPSLSTHIECAECEAWADASRFHWVDSSAADAWSEAHAWPPDPMWVESNWPLGVPAVELYLHEDPTTEAATLAAGLVVTAAAVGAAWWARRAFHAHMKTT